jgi:MGT family glycosyltransferase
VTFGTLFNADLGLFRLALDALADQPVDIVMTVGRDQDPVEFAPFPSNARVERFIPQAELLPSCAAIVHHGGAGTTFGALAHGVPQVILPQGADNYELAAMCEHAGAASVLRPDDVNIANFAAAVSNVLCTESFATAGRACAAEILSMPDAATTAAMLHAWINAH